MTTALTEEHGDVRLYRLHARGTTYPSQSLRHPEAAATLLTVVEAVAYRLLAGGHPHLAGEERRRLLGEAEEVVLRVEEFYLLEEVSQVEAVVPEIVPTAPLG